MSKPKITAGTSQGYTFINNATIEPRKVPNKLMKIKESDPISALAFCI
jgi:hypothetical protein